MQTRLVEIKAIPDLVCDRAEHPIFSWVNFLEDEGNFPLGYLLLYSPGHKRQHLLKSSRILECIEKNGASFFTAIHCITIVISSIRMLQLI